MKRKQRKCTPFETSVYVALQKIPKGKVTTYALLARAIGSQSARAVGGACRRNPHAPHVPCHRVVRSDLTLGGYIGQTQGAAVAKKERLLRSEGVKIKDGKVADPAQIFDFAQSTKV